MNAPRTCVGALVVLAALATATCGKGTSPDQLSPDLLGTLPWRSVVERARNTTVRFAMWNGDEARNRFFQGEVADGLAREFSITLDLVPLSETADLVTKLINEKQAGRLTNGSIDMVWINGENFRTTKQAGVLWGPFAEQLPNIRFFDRAGRASDFGTPTAGFEAPWEQAQFVFAYDSARVPSPPRSLTQLKAWIASHPGRFTYPAIPDFTGSAFIRHVLLHSGGVPPTAFQNGFDEALYKRSAARALAYLKDIRPSLWRGGDTYPATPADLNRLFVNNEVDFSMNYGPTFASDRIARGEFPPTVRTFVLDEGTIANFSYLAIPFNAANPGGAAVVIDYLMSPDHALARVARLGGVFPMLREPLTATQRAALDALPRGPATLSLDVLAEKRIPEADAEYLTRFERDWRREVLLQ